MSAKYFLDTNIFVYSFDLGNAAKAKIARTLIDRAISEMQGVVSWQVLQEFCHVATSKFKTPLTTQNLQSYLDTVLVPLFKIVPSQGIFEEALSIKDRWHYTFYDSLIISAAVSYNCKTLYSEDLQHQQRLMGLQVVNPFLE